MSGITITIQDNGLGQLPPGGANIIAVIGVSSAGSANSPFETSNGANFTTNFGFGPGPQAASLVAAQSGQQVIYVSTGVGSGSSVNAVTKNVPGGSTSTVTITGTTLDTYYILVTAVIGGTITTGPIQLNVSLDAGRTTYAVANLGTANTFVIPNTGLTLNFSAGTIVAADTWQSVAIEPKWTGAQLTSAISALTFTQLPFQDVLIVGDVAAADATTVDTAMTNLFNKRRYSRALTNARDAVWGGYSTETEGTWISAIATNFANFVSNRTSVSGGHYNVTSSVDQSQYRRPLSWLAAVRDANVPYWHSFGQVSDGPLVPIVLPSQPDAFGIFTNASGATGFIYHDEGSISGLDVARFLSGIKYVGFPGLYILNGNIMASPGSDFNLIQHGHVIDEASFIAYVYFTNLLQKAIRVNTQTGFILAQDANSIEQGCNAQLLANITGPGAASSALCFVTRNNNILSTNTLIATIQVVPLAYPGTINITLEYSNPAIQQV